MALSGKFPTTAALTGWLALSSGCSLGTCRVHILDTRLGPRLESVWDAHGGFENWRRFEGATLSWRVDFDDGTVLERDVLVRFDEPRSIWIRSASGGDWSEVALGRPSSGPVRASWRPAGTVSDDVADFALLSLRNLLQLPFGLASDGWEVRLDMRPAGQNGDVPSEIQASLRGPSPLGPYLLRWEADGGRLERVFYASCHPARPRAVYEVRLGGFREVQGLLVATRRSHFQRVPRPLHEVRDPLELASTAAVEEPPPAFREELAGIRFLTREELASVFDGDV